MEPTVHLRSVDISFAVPGRPPFHAVRGAELSVGPGEFVSIVGPTGCGKSTLLNAAAGLLTPAAGQVVIEGQPLQGLNRKAGYLFQADALMPWKTAGDNVAIGLEVAGVPRREAVARAHDWLVRVGLRGFADRYPHMLSGGQRKRVALAQMLIRDPDILLMDEPFGALDEIVRDRLNEALLALWRKTGKTIGFVTHSIPEAVYLSTRIVVMSPRPGRITRVIESTLPRDRPLDIRDTPEFIRIAHEVREGLREGHGHD
mgnify:CR=1 FL=1